MTNTDLKEKIRSEGFALWKIAAVLGVSEMSVGRWLRENGDVRHQREILDALDKLKAERAAATESEV